MTEFELEQMISLADDKYIEEAFEQKINVRRRFPVIIPIAAAAVVCGLFFAARPAETEIENMVASEVTTAVEELDEYNGNLRYWKYFDGDMSNAICRINEKAYYYVYIPNDYTEEISAFDFKYKPHGAVVYCDRYDAEIKLNMTINAGETEEGYPKVVNLWIYRDGPLNSTVPENATPETINGVDIYGYEDSEDIYADFILNDQSYDVSFSNIGYKEAYEIIEMLIERQLAVDSFNAAKDFKQSGMMLEQLCEVQPFGMYVPRKSQISDMPLIKGDTNGLTDYVETKVDDEIVRKTLYMWYSDQLGENKGKQILLKYCQYNYEPVYFNEEVEPILLSDLDINKMMKYAETWKKPDEVNSFDFRVDCNEFVIDIEAVCTANELWECICAIKGEAMHQTELEMLEQEQIHLPNQPIE